MVSGSPLESCGALCQPPPPARARAFERYVTAPAGGTGRCAGITIPVDGEAGNGVGDSV